MSEPFNADNIVVGNWEPVCMIQVRKRQPIVHACKLNFPEGFNVTLPDGRVVWYEPGDYLIIDGDGKKTPMDCDAFEASYEKRVGKSDQFCAIDVRLTT